MRRRPSRPRCRSPPLRRPSTPEPRGFLGAERQVPDDVAGHGHQRRGGDERRWASRRRGPRTSVRTMPRWRSNQPSSCVRSSAVRSGRVRVALDPPPWHTTAPCGPFRALWHAEPMTEHDPRHGALLRRWGAFVARHARAVVVAWLVLIVTGFAVALGAVGTPSLFDRLDSGEIVVDGENQQGRDLLAEGGGSGFSTYTQTLTGVGLSDPAVAAAAAAAAARPGGDRARRVRGQPVRRPRGPDQPRGPALRARRRPGIRRLRDRRDLRG